MGTTTNAVSLFGRIRLAPSNPLDWGRLCEIDRPLMRRPIGRVSGLRDVSADLVREILAAAFREIPRFHRRRVGSFRAWPRPVTVNHVRNHRRRRRPIAGLAPSDAFLDGLADPGGEVGRQWLVETGPGPRQHLS